jgi:outer membrane protein assembly factor BamB
MIIIKADREYEEVARYELGEEANACPAFLDGRIYIRGKENLYCIANPQK